MCTHAEQTSKQCSLHVAHRLLIGNLLIACSTGERERDRETDITIGFAQP